MHKDTYILRIIGRRKGNIYVAICLDTDIAVQGSSIEEVKHKMRDALLAYFRSFKSEEIERKEFLRSAPAKYWVVWHVLRTAGFLKKLVHFIVFVVNYDPSSNRVSLA